MSQYVAELCVLLVKDTFGDLYSIIYSSLVHHGRQPLIRIMRDTGLTRRQVMYGLAVLVQQHLIYHYTSVDDGLTYYEANWKATYNLTRSGKIVQLTKERLGGHAASVLEAILRLGHTTVSQLEALPELRVRKATPAVAKKLDIDNENGGDNSQDEALFMDEEPVEEQLPAVDDNGEAMDVDAAEDEYDDDESSAQLHSALSLLASHACIMRVRPAHFQSPGDLRDEVENSLRSRSDIRGLKGKRQEDAIAQGIEVVTQERLDGRIAAPVPPPVIPVSGLKRKADDDADDGDGRRKRTKLQDGTAAGDEGGEDEDEYDDDDDDDAGGEGVALDNNMVIRVNYAKFDVISRNQRLIELARENTTNITSHVYATLLARIETRTATCRAQEERLLEGEEAEQYSVAVSLQTISNDIDPSIDLMADFGGNGPSDKGRTDPLDDDDFADTSSAATARNRVFEVEQHLSFLAQEPWNFSTRNMNTGLITWSVEYRHLARHLRHLELERLVESRFGPVAVRLIRILTARGKLEEKALQDIGLIAIKDLRTLLGQMEAAGIVELQEVPRDQQRQPSKTMYLWTFDADRVVTVQTENIYKSMSRIFQRMDVERGKLRFLLEKAERSDVKGHEDKFFTAAEWKTLQEWKLKERTFFVELSRLDDLVAVFRDY